jgi:hypothetical protein
MDATRLFLKSINTANPTVKDAENYYSTMAESKLARSTINIRSAAQKAFYRSRDMELALPHLKVTTKIPYFFLYLKKDSNGHFSRYSPV